MKEIKIIVPDDYTEYEAILNAEGCFNPKQNDYKNLKYRGKHQKIAMIFGNNRVGDFYNTEKGYVLHLREKEDGNG